jgi:hypothetical protein
MKRIEPDRAALEIARSMLRTTRPLNELLAVPSLRKVLETVARRHMKNRAKFDPKKAQSGDLD